MFRQPDSHRAFSLLELLVVMALGSILLGVALFNAKDYENQALTAASSFAGYLKTVRAKALATTYAYTLSAESPTQVVAKYSSTCSSETQTDDIAMNFILPAGTQFSEIPWSLCFTARGLSDSSQSISIQDHSYAKTVQIVLGGAVRVL